jgi:hypothetical protein
MSRTEENYVVEFRLEPEGGGWLTFTFINGGHEHWKSVLPKADARERLSFRLVKRTAVITDEVLDEDPVSLGECSVCGGEGVIVRAMQEDWWMEAGVPEYLCTDQSACEERYDKITKEEGWMR